MAIGIELGPEVGEPPGSGEEGTPLAIGIGLGSVVGELLGGDMVTGNKLGSVVGEPPGNELGSVVGEPLGDGHGGTPLAIGIELGPEMGEPPGGGKEGTLFFPDIGHGTATSAGSGWRSDSGA